MTHYRSFVQPFIHSFFYLQSFQLFPLTYYLKCFFISSHLISPRLVSSSLLFSSLLCFTSHFLSFNNPGSQFNYLSTLADNFGAMLLLLLLQNASPLQGHKSAKPAKVVAIGRCRSWSWSWSLAQVIIRWLKLHTCFQRNLLVFPLYLIV